MSLFRSLSAAARCVLPGLFLLPGSLLGQDGKALFGLVEGANAAKVAETLEPILPEGASKLRFGEADEQVAAKRAGVESEKMNISGKIPVDETFPEATKVPDKLLFYNIRYSYGKEKRLRSLRFAGQYDDRTFKFEQIKNLFSACFQGFGKPLKVIQVERDARHPDPALYLVWKVKEYDVILRLERSISSERINLFWVLEAPVPGEAPMSLPENGKVSQPSSADFKKLYEAWLAATQKK